MEHIRQEDGGCSCGAVMHWQYQILDEAFLVMHHLGEHREDALVRYYDEMPAVGEPFDLSTFSNKWEHCPTCGHETILPHTLKEKEPA